MYEFFEQLLQTLNVTTADVCRSTGIGQATISTWKKRNSILGAEYLLKLAEYFNVPMEFFMTGKLPEVPEHFDPIGHEFLELFFKLNKEQKDTVLNTMRLLALSD